MSPVGVMVAQARDLVGDVGVLGTVEDALRLVGLVAIVDRVTGPGQWPVAVYGVVVVGGWLLMVAATVATRRSADRYDRAMAAQAQAPELVEGVSWSP